MLQSRRLLLLAHGSTHALLTCVCFQKLGYPSSPLLSPSNMTNFCWFWGPILGKIHLVMGTWNRTGLLYLHQKGGLRTALPLLKASHGLCGWWGLLVDLSWSEAPGCPLTNTAGGVSGSHGKLGIWVLALWPWSKQLWLGGERLKPKFDIFHRTMVNQLMEWGTRLTIPLGGRGFLVATSLDSSPTLASTT